MGQYYMNRSSQFLLKPAIPHPPSAIIGCLEFVKKEYFSMQLFLYTVVKLIICSHVNASK